MITRSQSPARAHGPYRLLFAVVLLLLAGGLAAETLAISRPTLSPADGETRRFLDGQIVRAIADARARYPGLDATYNGFATSVDPAAAAGGASGTASGGDDGGGAGRAGSSRIRVDVVATSAAGSTMLVFTGTASSGMSESVVYRMPWHDALYREIASMLGFLHGVLRDTAQVPDGRVVFLQEFQSEFVATGDLPAGSVMQPYSLASRNGNLLIASGSFVLETDGFFREQAKIGLESDLAGFWAMHVGATPAGTIAAASAGQGGIVRLVPEIPEPYRLPTRNAVMAMAVGDDGAVYTLDMQQRFMRFTSGEAGPVDLNLPEGTFISFMATGPENTLLLWEPSQRAILVYDGEGERIGTIMPHIPMDVALGMKHFQAYENGDIFAVFADRMMRFSGDGRPLWVVHADDLPELGGLAAFTEIHLDPATGTIHLLNIQQKRIVQLTDLAARGTGRSLTPTEERLLALNAELRANPYDQDALARRARLYEEAEAWELAAYTWETAYGINPGNSAVADARDRAVLRSLEENALRLSEQTMDLLDRYGTASASYPYQRAQEAFEQLISEGSPEVRARARDQLEELRGRYREAEEPDRSPPPLTITDVAIEDIFPSLFTSYQQEPAGEVIVTNEGDQTVRNVSLTARMRFLEFPTPGGTVSTLAPGETAGLAVSLPVSSQTLRLQESTPTPVSLTLRYEDGGQEHELSRVELITVHRATALTWDDSAKLAAYVTPRDQIVEEFAAPFVGVGPAEALSVSEKLFRAARIADALATGGIEYIEDPRSGITEVLGNPSVIDTVRFPRPTVRVGYGDCDDTTALLASLYESVGIATAIMTSPGHVFLAFDTGEPEQNRWLFESERTAALVYKGTVWLPFETTILHEGFLASWEEGSRLYRRHADDGTVEFIPLETVRGRFPPLPLEPASFRITPPPEELVGPAYTRSREAIRETLYLANVASIERELAASSGRRRVRSLNQLGILHGRFAQVGRAREAFLRAVEDDASYAASYINLANLELLRGAPGPALEWLDRAEEQRSGSVLVTLLRAQAEYLAGDRAAAAERMATVRERAPELAAQYPHLAGGETGTARASEAAAGAVLPWAAY